MRITDECLYTFDANGNVGQLVDASDGSLKAEYEYDPFGGIIKQTGSAASDNPFRFSTKYEDDETGLSYYGYRYYDAEKGRWVNRDPLTEEGGLNIYAFVQNEPISDIDFLGLSGTKEGTPRLTVRFVYAGDASYGKGDIAALEQQLEQQLEVVRNIIQECKKMAGVGFDCPECSGITDENAFNIRVKASVDSLSGGHLDKLKPRKRKRWTITTVSRGHIHSPDSDVAKLILGWQSMGQKNEIPVIFTKYKIRDTRGGGKPSGLSNHAGDVIGVLLASDAGKYTLAHELGHIIGYEGTGAGNHAPAAHKDENIKPHDTGKSNIMSQHEGGTKPDCHYCVKLAEWQGPDRAVHRPTR